MTTQRIALGDCLDVFADERNVPAFVSDPPANIGFMGRSWDKSNPALDFVLPGTPRSKTHDNEWRRKESFIRYWQKRYGMAYDVADQHAINIVWTLPRTSHQMAEALERAGWTIKDNLVHLFGSGWAKTGNALAPGQEGWILATKGRPELDIDACRVPRGGNEHHRTTVHESNERRTVHGTHKTFEPTNSPLGSLPKNAVLSHCEGCVRVGSKRVKGASGGNPTERRNGAVYSGTDQRRSTISHAPEGTESVPAFHCLAGCVCGARAPWPDDRSLPRCPCGETWRWLCPVAEINGQGKASGVHSAGTKAERGSMDNMVEIGYGSSHISQSFRHGDIENGSNAARFFNTFAYLSKCSPSERHAGCENLYWKADKKDPFGFVQVTREEWEALPNDQRAQGNVHPTVKSYRLMRWLHSLTGAKRILDLAAGSGTGMYTAYLDGIEWLGAEICPQAIVIAKARLAFWQGLSFEARDAFMRDDAVPRPVDLDQRQATLF